jgi:hypothetical protein
MGGVLALSGILVTGAGAAPGPGPGPARPAAVVAPAPGVAPAAPQQEQAPPPAERQRRSVTPADDPALTGTPAAIAFLEAMRAADVPTSRTGLAEVRVAGAACTELASGTSAADLARRIPSGLPTVTRAQAAELVELAQEHYCE